MDIDNDCSCKALIFGSTCVSRCPSFSSENEGVCECLDTFIMRDNTCVCNYLVSLDQKKCSSECGAHQKDVGGRCVCADHYRQRSGDSGSCVFHLKATEYAGICVGAALLMALVILVVILVIKQKAKKKHEGEQLRSFKSAGSLQFDDDSVQMRSPKEELQRESQSSQQDSPIRGGGRPPKRRINQSAKKGNQDSHKMIPSKLQISEKQSDQ